MTPPTKLKVEGDLIFTSHVINAEEALGRLIERSGLGAFIGPAGVGKTYVLRRLIPKFDDLKVIWIEPVVAPTQRQLALKIAVEINESVQLRTRAQIFDFLIKYLRAAALAGKVLLVVDEAQRLGKKCIEDLRYLHDQVGEGFVLALLGGKKCWDVIEGDLMLRSRVRRKSVFGYLKEAEAIRMARAYHEIYQGASNEILCQINKACRGRFRTWYLFTDEAAGLCQELGKERIDPDIVRQTCLLMNGEAS